MRAGLCSLLLLIISAVPTDAQSTKCFTASDGLKLHYQVWGVGEPLFLISMGPGYAPNYLFGVASELSDTFQVVLLHQRGTGLSRMESISETNMNVELCLKDIEDLREYLGAAKISLMGNSFGGLLTMSYATTYPNRVKSIIMAGSAGIDLEFLTYFRSNIHSRLSIREVEEIKEWNRLIQQNQRVKEAHYEMMKLTVPAYFADKRNAEAFLQHINEESFNHQISDLLWMDLMKQGYDLKSKFKTFDGQALIIIGRQDIVGESTAEKMHEHIPRSELLFLEDCGHIPWIEQPDAFYEAVRGFLAH